VDCLAVHYIPNIRALEPVWLYNIFNISAHFGLSGSTIYSTYQRTVICLALQFFPHIRALCPCCISYFTLSHNPHDFLENILNIKRILYFLY